MAGVADTVLSAELLLLGLGHYGPAAWSVRQKQRQPQMLRRFGRFLPPDGFQQWYDKIMPRDLLPRRRRQPWIRVQCPWRYCTDGDNRGRMRDWDRWRHHYHRLAT